MSNIISESQLKYLDVRKQALELENTIEKAQGDYVKQLHEVINKIKKEFLEKYGEKINELEEMQFGIQQVQEKGRFALNRKLQNLYKQHGGSGGNARNENPEIMRKKIKELYDEYKKIYFPNDDYQIKRNMEARKLKDTFLMLNNGGGGGGGGSIPVHAGGRSMLLLDDDDDDEEQG